MIRIDDSDLQDAMRHLGRAFAKAANGKTLKRQASKNLRAALKPLVAARRAAVLRLPSNGHSGAGMRQAVARQIRPATRWGGKNVGVSVVQKARGMPRNFNMAGRMFNREEGWSPQNIGGVTVHQQVTPALWFDSQAEKDRPMVRRQVIAALEETAAIMADDIRRIR